MSVAYVKSVVATSNVSASNITSGGAPVLKVQTGQGNVSSSPITITFSVPFSTVPSMFGTVHLAFNSSTMYSIQFSNITTTNCQVQAVYMNSGSSINVCNGDNYNWVAIGT